jgi:Phage integrase central domain
MFVREKTARGHRYLYLVESVRDGGRVRQQIVRALGRKDVLLASGELDRLVASLARHSERAMILSEMEAGRLACTRIGGPLLFGRIEPIWAAKTETASRLRGRIESILDWAATRGYRKGDNPARWRGHLDNLLPKRTKVRKVQHHAALPYVCPGRHFHSGAARSTGCRRAGTGVLHSDRNAHLRDDRGGGKKSTWTGGRYLPTGLRRVRSTRSRYQRRQPQSCRSSPQRVPRTLSSPAASRESRYRTWLCWRC